MDAFDYRSRNDSRVRDEIENITFDVIGAAIEVHRELGPELLEVHYKKALSRGLTLRSIPHLLEVELEVSYRGESLGSVRADLVVRNLLIVELKCVEASGPVHKTQALTYLRLAKLPLALVINFNVAILRDGIKRVINTQ